jgi:hypothetical protein
MRPKTIKTSKKKYSRIHNNETVISPRMSHQGLGVFQSENSLCKNLKAVLIKFQIRKILIRVFL